MHRNLSRHIGCQTTLLEIMVLICFLWRVEGFICSWQYLLEWDPKSLSGTVDVCTLTESPKLPNLFRVMFCTDVHGRRTSRWTRDFVLFCITWRYHLAKIIKVLWKTHVLEIEIPSSAMKSVRFQLERAKVTFLIKKQVSSTACGVWRKKKSISAFFQSFKAWKC